MKLFQTSFMILGATFILASCSQSTPSDSQEKQAEKEQVSEKEPAAETPMKYDQLDNLDLASWKKTLDKNTEAGDCESNITRYESNGLKLVIDKSDCGDYGNGITYYLANESNELQMVHEKRLSSYYDDKTNKPVKEITERRIDFTGGSTEIKQRKTMVDMTALDLKVKYDENYQSEAWIVLSEKSDDLLFGEKIDFKGDWMSEMKNGLKTKLSTMDVLPRTIPTEMKGTVGMGYRGDIRDLCQEAIAEVASEKEYELMNNYDYFQHLTGDFTAVPADEYSNRAYWTKIYLELTK